MLKILNFLLYCLCLVLQKFLIVNLIILKINLFAPFKNQKPSFAHSIPILKVSTVSSFDQNSDKSCRSWLTIKENEIPYALETPHRVVGIPDSIRKIFGQSKRQ